MSAAIAARHPDPSRACVCPAYELDKHASRAVIASALLEEGAIGLHQIDLWYYDAIVAVRTERARQLRERMRNG